MHESTKHNALVCTYGEGVLDYLELLGGVLRIGHHLADDSLNVIHPFQVLGTAEVVDFLHKTVIFLPKTHDRGGVALEQRGAVIHALHGRWMKAEKVTL